MNHKDNKWRMKKTWRDSSVYPSLTLFKFDTSTTMELPFEYPSFPSVVIFESGSVIPSWELEAEMLGARGLLGEAEPPTEAMLLSKSGMMAQEKESL